MATEFDWSGFRREFWTRIARLHPGDVQQTARSYVHFEVAGTDLRIGHSVASDRVNCFLIGLPGEGLKATCRIAMYREALMRHFGEEPSSKWANYFNECDTRNPDNWEALADWLAQAYRVFEKVLRGQSTGQDGSEPSRPRLRATRS